MPTSNPSRVSMITRDISEAGTYFIALHLQKLDLLFHTIKCNFMVVVCKQVYRHSWTDKCFASYQIHLTFKNDWTKTKKKRWFLNSTVTSTMCKCVLPCSYWITENRQLKTPKFKSSRQPEPYISGLAIILHLFLKQY